MDFYIQKIQTNCKREWIIYFSLKANFDILISKYKIKLKCVGNIKYSSVLNVFHILEVHHLTKLNYFITSLIEK